MTSSNTVSLHRVFKAPAERVYRAFLDPHAIVKWLSPYGYSTQVHHLDARVGGTHRMSFYHFASGKGHEFGGTYLELIPGEKLRYNDQFDDPNLPGVMEVTVTLKPVLCGTDVTIVQSGIPSEIPVEMCYLGWQESLAQLALLVDTEIPMGE